MSKRWRMDEPGRDCPFNNDGPGLALRKSLRPGRFTAIKADLKSAPPSSERK